MIIKICGIRNISDAKFAVEAGADMLGFVFAESIRRIEPRRALEISRAVDKKVIRVGVFVNEILSKVSGIVKKAGLDLVQLHGRESPDYCRSVPAGVIKALRIKDRESLLNVEQYIDAASFILLDSYHPDRAGGTGRSFDWNLVKEMGRYEIPWILAGGLNSQNVYPAIKKYRPDGVDVSGGVESQPGIKNHKLIFEFIRNAKGG